VDLEKHIDNGAGADVKRILGRLKRDFARVQKEATTILTQAKKKVCANTCSLALHRTHMMCYVTRVCIR
jgi:hypothetical protein